MLAQRTLNAMTGRVSEAMSTFSSWLLGGFGATFALLLANIASVSQYVSISHIRFALFCFVAGLLLAIIAR